MREPIKLTPLATDDSAYVAEHGGEERESCDRAQILIDRFTSSGYLTDASIKWAKDHIRIALDMEVEAGGPYLVKRAESHPLPDATQDADEIVSALYRRFKEWSKRGFGPEDVTWCEVKADVLALIHAAKPLPAPVEESRAFEQWWEQGELSKSDPDYVMLRRWCESAWEGGRESVSSPIEEAGTQEGER